MPVEYAGLWYGRDMHTTEMSFKELLQQGYCVPADTIILSREAQADLAKVGGRLTRKLFSKLICDVLIEPKDTVRIDSLGRDRFVFCAAKFAVIFRPLEGAGKQLRRVERIVREDELAIVTSAAG